MNSTVESLIYCFWTGDNPLTPNRLKGLESMRENLGIPICFLDKKGIVEKILPEAPLHPAYQYLSCNHQSDYLRCYFMHHFGGGYADIKPYSKNNNWKQCFDYINRYQEINIIGQHEIRHGIADRTLRSDINAEKLIACGWMICRPYSAFSSEWFRRVNRVLDLKFNEVKHRPATEPFGGPRYPLRWAELCGEIFHKLQNEVYALHPKAIRNVLRTGWLGIETEYR